MSGPSSGKALRTPKREQTLSRPASTETSLLGMGLYTVAEAALLIGLRAERVSRWLRGHHIGSRLYEPLWLPQIDLGDGTPFLSFRDLQEARVVAAFIAMGLSPQRVRQAIVLARDMLEEERPLSTNRFRTDGRSIFLHVIEEDGQARLIDLFKRQFAFRDVIERSLKNLEFDESGSPARWWPSGKDKSILVDPARSFGQPIEAETSIPTATLVAAAKAEGSVEAAARNWGAPARAVRAAISFENHLAARTAA